MSDQDFDPEDAAFEQDAGQLFALARRSSRKVPPGAKMALHAAVLTAAATTTSAAAAGAGAAVAAPAGSVVASTTAASTTAGQVATTTTAVTVATSGSVALKTLLGGLTGVLLGTVLVAASVASESTSRPPAPADARSAGVRAETPNGGAATSASLAPSSATASAQAAPDSVPTETTPAPLRVVRSGRPNVNPPDEPPPPAQLPPQPTPATSADSLADEAAALRDVSRALAQGNPDEALRLLGEAPPGGSLAEERAAARIVALCRSGRRDEAAPLRAAFEAEHPRSNQRPRIEKACAAP